MSNLLGELINSFFPGGKNQKTGYFLRKGCTWIKKHLVEPLSVLENMDLDLNACLLSADVSYLLGDIAYLNSGYSVANRYYNKCYQLLCRNREHIKWQNEDWEYLYDDLAITSAYLDGKGLPCHFSEEWRKLFGESFVAFSLPKIPNDMLLANDFLCDFRFSEILSIFHDDIDDFVYVPRTLAYAQTGCWDIFWERFANIMSMPSFRQNFGREKLVFLPEECFDEERFWKLLLEGSCLLDFDVTFNINTVQCVPVDHYYHFHLARTTNDKERMVQLFQLFPQWEELLCVLRYFRKKGKMPSWKELTIMNKSPWL